MAFDFDCHFDWGQKYGGLWRNRTMASLGWRFFLAFDVDCHFNFDWGQEVWRVVAE